MSDLITLLKQVPGAISYDGDASVQVILPLKDGSHVRVGRTDAEVSASGTNDIWWDRYGGLNNEIIRWFRELSIKSSV